MITIRSAKTLNNELSLDLHLAADRLAPKVAESARESGCTDVRPTGSRGARAWDYVRLCYHLNSFCDDEDLSAAFIAVTEGGTVAVPLAGDHDHDEWHCARCWGVEELEAAVALWTRLFPKGWGTPLERARAEHERRMTVFVAARDHLAYVGGSDAAWDARRAYDAALLALQQATRTYNDRHFA